MHIKECMAASVNAKLSSAQMPLLNSAFSFQPYNPIVHSFVLLASLAVDPIIFTPGIQLNVQLAFRYHCLE